MPNRSISSSLRSNLFRREDIVWKFLKIVSILAQSLAFCRESCPIVVISALRKEESRSRIRGGEPVFRRRKSVSRDISLTNRFQLVREILTIGQLLLIFTKQFRSQCFRIIHHVHVFPFLSPSIILRFYNIFTILRS